MDSFLSTWSLIIPSSVQNTKRVDFSCGYSLTFGIHHSCWTKILILVSPENSSLIMVFRILVSAENSSLIMAFRIPVSPEHSSLIMVFRILVSPENSSLIMVFRIRVGFSYW